MPPSRSGTGSQGNESMDNDHNKTRDNIVRCVDLPFDNSSFQHEMEEAGENSIIPNVNGPTLTDRRITSSNTGCESTDLSHARGLKRKRDDDSIPCSSHNDASPIDLRTSQTVQKRQAYIEPTSSSPQMPAVSRYCTRDDALKCSEPIPSISASTAVSEDKRSDGDESDEEGNRHKENISDSDGVSAAAILERIMNDEPPFPCKKEKGAKRKGKVKQYEHIDHPLLRRYSYQLYENGMICCYLCDRKTNIWYDMLLHLEYVHGEELKFINDHLKDSLRSTRKDIITIDENITEYTNEQNVCLLCHTFVSPDIGAKHLEECPRGSMALIQRGYNYIAIPETFIALSQNQIQFDQLIGTYSCNICEDGLKIRYPNQEAILCHVKNHEDDLNMCLICNDEIRAVDYDAHFKENHPDYVHMKHCEHCDFTTAEMSRLEKHMRVKHPRKLVCPVQDCDRFCLSEESYRQHIIIDHLNAGPRRPEIAAIAPVQQSKKTMANIKPEFGVKCKHCESTIPVWIFNRNKPSAEKSGYDVLKDHLETHHSDYIATLPQVDIWPCARCKKSFFGKASFENHIVFCDGPRKCPYEGCNVTFEKKLARLINHIKSTHLRKYACICDLCGLELRNERALKEHKLTVHEKQKPIVCEICGRSFGRADNLRVHMRKHTGEKPIKCDYCDFRGTQRNNVTWHMKTKHKDKFVQI